MNEYISVCQPALEGNERKYLEECIDSGWISSEGPFVERFEEAYARYLGVRHGTAVSSGTAALETALYAIGIEPGDEVIMPSFTIISCAYACLRLGAVPVLVDIDPDVWTMDVTSVERKITDKTKAVMAVHMYGHPVEMDELLKIKEKYSIAIVEDAAESHGAEYQSNGTWKKCGAIGDISATSFYANKIISAGEGGMVLTDSSDYYDRARRYRNLGFNTANRFRHEHVGYNFRMTNMQAAVGLAQLEQIDNFLDIKQKLASLYRSRIENITGIRFMHAKSWAHPVYWMYCVELEHGGSNQASMLIDSLRVKGIGSRPFFTGLHEQPVLKDIGLFKREDYPATEAASRYGFYLPSSVTLKEEEIDRIVNSLSASLHRS